MKLSGDTTLVARWKREWTCPVHIRPQFREYDERDDELTWNWPIYGCTCDTSANWHERDGELEFVLESGFGRILKDYYMPIIVQSLDQEGPLLTRVSETPPQTLVRQRYGTRGFGVIRRRTSKSSLWRRLLRR